jgi:broad specificity phosphatase PhoE
VRKRLESFLEEVRVHHKDKKVLIVTHGGIIRSLHALLKRDIPFKRQSNASLSEFEI